MSSIESFTIRRAAESDAEAIHALNESALKYDYPLESTRRRLFNILDRKRSIVLVASVQEQVVGYIQGDMLEASYMEPMVKIEALAVDSSRRHIGIGRRLMESIEQWAVEHGVSFVLLNSGEERHDAHRFYAAIGYTRGKKEVHFTKQLPRN
ncbi:GNAT family N-acetyltransferase [Bifidobacterium sp.]|jgi:predicted N-acetyltransferase YhbS|uniref:GNAT family N-acetyltransferase n=1 Tax=Bifidobacterium sp. TaxID=41200 RepID=UPI0025C3CF98|nr:GNAT family N-acetyltransferase [Bifidobacterium sp.]MCI1636173.1 GNAT family N-acetyltransferase [Bifidobacterium sp.]